MLRPREMCSTTKTAARRSRGRSATIRLIASTPPAEAPMTTTSGLGIPSHLLGAELCKARDIARWTGVVRAEAFALRREGERQGDGEGVELAHLPIEPGLRVGPEAVCPSQEIGRASCRERV